jgi:ubiquinone/menaquinone biosynthesis C-methylase UbiE
MPPKTPATEYLLGSSDAEHDRLIRQAARISPITKNFFLEAGIAPGHRVLDIGSGVGDVAMLAASLVGPSGEVVAVERDARSVAKAVARATEAGYRNISFVECDVSQLPDDKPFDAAVGRFILQFLPDPVAVLRSLSRIVRPGGIIAFQEQSWAPFVLLSSHLPLWSAAVSLLYEVSRRMGVRMEQGPSLHMDFQNAGLPAPRMRLVMELGYDPDFTRWVSDVVRTLEPKIRALDLPLESLGDLETLQNRLQQ